MVGTVSDEPEEHILVRGVTKRFGDFAALSDIDMRVARGHVVVIIGGSGAGKTTLLKILIGLDKPSSGEVFIAGTNIVLLSERQMNAVRRKIAMVFQYSALLDSMNVMENVAFPLREHTPITKRKSRSASSKLKIRSSRTSSSSSRVSSAVCATRRPDPRLMLEPGSSCTTSPLWPRPIITAWSTISS
jgi:ABC-type transporter Mla maintaining outer membrane lipid asymmetry ATPase subunit MlaF